MTNTTANRIGNKWTVNEVLSLQREYELLNWSIDEIAAKHKRTANAIMFKLDSEGFADYNVLYSNYHKLNSTIPENRVQRESSVQNVLKGSSEDLSDDEEEYNEDNDEDYIDNADDEQDDDEDEEDDEMANLSERMDNLESDIDEIKSMLKQLLKSNQKNGTEHKRAPESNRGPKGEYVKEYPGYN